MVRKRVITLGIVLGLMVNWIIIQAEQAKSADNYIIPQYIMDDMQKNVGYSNKTINNYDGQRNQQPQQVVTMDRNLYNQPQPIQYSRQVTIDQNVYRQPTQTQNNNYYQYQQVNSYDPNRPEWKDFAPYGWDNVTLDPKEGTYWAPSKMNQAIARRYWYERRKDFEKDLTQCDILQGDYKYACYEKLKIRQISINEQKKQKEQEEYIMQMQRQQLAQQQQALNQAAAAAADERNFQREQMNQQMMMNYLQNSPFRQQPKYRFYDNYGRSQGYVQQSSW